MKATELRIGNLVIGISNTPEKIELISESEVDTNVHDALLINQIEGIPLTEEWLEKFGFEYDGFDWVKDNINLKLDSEERLHLIDSTDYGIIVGRCIDSVHKLQNLYFALRGEELTIKELA